MAGTTPSQTVGPYFSIGLPWPDGPHVVDPGTGQRYVADWRNRAGRDAGGFYGTGYSLGTWTDQPHGFGPGLTLERVSANGKETALLPSAETTGKGGRVYSRELGEDLTVGGARVGALRPAAGVQPEAGGADGQHQGRRRGRQHVPRRGGDAPGEPGRQPLRRCGGRRAVGIAHPRVLRA